jgi:hypothetical protein
MLRICNKEKSPPGLFDCFYNVFVFGVRMKTATKAADPTARINAINPIKVSNMLRVKTLEASNIDATTSNDTWGKYFR